MIHIKKGAKFNAWQLKTGTRIEHEHTTSNATAKRIAEQHLTEFPNYYTYLVKMENKLKRMKK